MNDQTDPDSTLDQAIMINDCSFIVIDPKGEIVALFEMPRHRLSRVVVLNPIGNDGERRACDGPF